MELASRYIPLLSRSQEPLIRMPFLSVHVMLDPSALPRQASWAASGITGSGGGAVGAGGAGGAGGASGAGGTGATRHRPRAGQLPRSADWLAPDAAIKAANSMTEIDFMVFSWLVDLQNG